MTRRPLAAVALAVAIAPPALAGPAVTLYTQDLGFVRENRSFAASGPRSTVRLEGVSNQLDFSSVRLAPTSGRVSRLAYRWDTGSGDRLLEGALGARVRTVSRGERIVEGELLSVDGSWLVLLTSEGAVVNVSRASLEEVRLERQPSAMALRPAIEAVIDGARAGKLEAELSYLTGGLSWSAEHTLVRTGETSARFGTHVQVQNTTGRVYEDATVRLIAGDPARTSAMPMTKAGFGDVAMMAMSAERGADMTEQSFADYHLYSLKQPVTLRDRESQSLVMLETRDVQVKPRYLYTHGDGRGVRARLELVNSQKSGPGAPLPGGRVRTFAADNDGALQFTGESMIRHTPIDEKFQVELGYAFDIAAERKELSAKRISDREREYTVQISLRNRKAVDATVTVEEPAGGDWDLVRSSLPGARRDAQTLVFEVALPAGREVVLTYTARQRW